LQLGQVFANIKVSECGVDTFRHTLPMMHLLHVMR
jgi:hypothetical protein